MSYLFPWMSLEKPSFGEFTTRKIFENSLHDIFIAKNIEDQFMIFFVCRNDYTVLISEAKLLLKSIHLDLRRNELLSTNYLILTLLDSEFLPLFDAFINFILAEIYMEIDEERLIESIVIGLKEWRSFLSIGSSGLLSEEKIRGIIGELFYLDLLLKKYPKDRIKILKSWYGPEKIQYDFVFDNVNVEVKTIANIDKNIITISSIYQLDNSNMPLYLMVFGVFLVNGGAKESYSLNSLYRKIINKLDVEEKNLFNSKVLECGYIENQRYDDYFYLIKEIGCYEVSEDFPRIISSMIPYGVIDVKYTLDLNLIKNYKVDQLEVF